MNEATCKNCAFYEDGICHVILWTAGKREQIGQVPDDGHCELWERK